MLNLQRAQNFMVENKIDAWLVYDFRGNNPVLASILDKRVPSTRRLFLIIPFKESPTLVCHSIDSLLFSESIYKVITYISWEDMHSKLNNLLEDFSTVAMEYSPGGSIPISSWVDGGTIDHIRSLGKDICSSANLFQVAAAAWDDKAYLSHKRVCTEVAEIKDLAFDLIRNRILNKASINEYEVQEFIMEEFNRRNLETEDRPVVAINQNSGDPHYEPTKDHYSAIKDSDWVLIDLWARYPGDQNIFSDITWVGYVGRIVPDRYIKIFDHVIKARDLSIQFLKNAWKKELPVQGWQVDRVARNYISEAGFGENFIHRTGHSIGPGATLHALGVNLDDLETHDTRKLLPNTGFSVEPGIYLSDFGVRSEVNIYIDPNEGPLVTTPIQETIVLMG